MRKPRLLIVDDEIPFTTNLLKLLSRRGYEVSAVNDGYSALRIVEEDEFDVVILDQKMPGIDGITTLKELKKKRPHMEVILLTGRGSIESGIQGLQLGAFNYVMKPVAFPELLEQIVQAYERKIIEEERSQE